MVLRNISAISTTVRSPAIAADFFLLIDIQLTAVVFSVLSSMSRSSVRTRYTIEVYEIPAPGSTLTHMGQFEHLEVCL